MARRAMPRFPFVEARHVGDAQKPTAVVLKLSSTTSEEGAALGIANYHHRPGAPFLSYHYIVDEARVYQCVPDNVSAYSNSYRAINILICAEPQEDVALWHSPTTAPVMHQAAALVADVLLAYKIRPRYLDLDAETRWLEHRWRRRGGIIVRAEGAWPYESFLGDVEAQMVIKTM